MRVPLRQLLSLARCRKLLQGKGSGGFEQPVARSVARNVDNHERLFNQRCENGAHGERVALIVAADVLGGLERAATD